MGKHQTHGVYPLLVGLLRKAVHQVQVYVGEPGAPSGSERLQRLVRGVPPPKQGQKFVVQALDADA